MGGYDPKVIKNREKLHFFFVHPSFCFLHFAKQRDFVVKSALHSCELVATSSPLPLNFLRFSPSFFVKSPPFSLKTSAALSLKISVVFAQTMDFLEISGLRDKTSVSLSLKISSALSLKTSPSLSLETSVVLPQKSPPHEVQRGLVIVFRD